MKINESSFIKNHKLSAVFLLSMVIVTALNVFAAPDSGELDRAFSPTILSNGEIATVRDTVVQPDGKTIIVGTILKVNNQQVNHVARFNADGTLDATFDAGGAVVGGFFGDVNLVALQPDGKIIVGGRFEQVARQTRYGLARLNADGSFDPTFNANLNATLTGTLTSIIVQTDGRILVGGGDIAFNTGTNTTTTRRGIVRLNSDGSLDAAFNPFSASTQINSVALQTDSKILISGGDFTFGSQTRSQVARLNTDGSLDANFVGTTYDSTVFVVAPQANGKIYVGGAFNTVGGQTQKNLARLNTDGTRDAGFATSSGIPFVKEIYTQSDGKVIYSGDGGTAYRSNPDGTRDTGFTTRSRVQTNAYKVNVLPDDRVIVGGANMQVFTMVGGSQIEVRNFVILAADGTLDDSVNPYVSFSGGGAFVNYLPTVIPQPDGKVLYASDAFFEVNRVARRNIVRLNSDGSTDTTFNLPSGLISSSSRVAAMAQQADGKIIFSNVGTTNSTDAPMARLNADGSRDTTFANVVVKIGAANGAITSIHPQPNGQIIIFGSFGTINGQARENLARLNADGSLDAFNPKVTNGFTINGNVGSVLVQPNGKFLLLGAFSTPNSPSIARFNADGSLDTSFNATVNVAGKLLAVQPDGKILSGLARLNADGSRDTSFNPPSFAININTAGSIIAAVVMNNGKILVVGKFNFVNLTTGGGIPRTGFAFLNADGSLDTTSGINGGAIVAGSVNNNTGTIAAAALQPDGNALIAGIFQYVNNFSQPTLARLKMATVNRNNIADFDGDGKTDVSVFRPSNGTWYLQNSTAGFFGAQFGAATDKIVPSDYDGDGKTDLAVFRSGVWYIQRSQAGFTGISFGASDDIPAPGDYDGDGKADVAVFRPSNGTWYLQRSQAGFVGISFGQAGDKPVAADYDGDGKIDLAVNRSGVWYIQRSQLGFTGITFGDGNDRPTPADFDGDGKADVAVFRPSNGTWYLQRSQLGFVGIQFGASGDVPVAGDYDGDGTADVAVFRNGTWYLQRSTQGFLGVSFGATTDTPVPAAFVR